MDASELFTIKSNTTKPFEGQVLLAEPMLNSLHFGRSVILLIEVSPKEGCFGIIINKPISVQIDRLSDDLPFFDAPVFVGGPVDENRLFFLHTLGDEVPESIKIMDGLYWGGDLDIIKSLIISGQANRSNLRFFLGYAGWESGQLEKELKENTWAVGDINTHQIMTNHPEKLWSQLTEQLGGRYRYWKMFPKDPRMN